MGEEKKEPEKKYEWVDVVKKKKQTKRTDVDIMTSHCPGLAASEVQRLMDLETAMQTEMQEIIDTDEKRNDLETYIFNMRDKTSESGEYGAFITNATAMLSPQASQPQRIGFMTLKMPQK